MQYALFDMSHGFIVECNHPHTQEGLHSVLLRLCDAAYDAPETLFQATRLLHTLPTAPDIAKVQQILPY